LRDATKTLLVQETFKLGEFRVSGGEEEKVEEVKDVDMGGTDDRPSEREAKNILHIETWKEYQERVMSVEGAKGKRKRVD
jgi:hypothetical protein